MKIEEAIVYVMVKRNGGMTTDQIADAINRQGLHQRKDGQPVRHADKAIKPPIIFIRKYLFARLSKNSLFVNNS